MNVLAGNPVPKYQREEILEYDSELWMQFLFWRIYLILPGLVFGCYIRMSMLDIDSNDYFFSIVLGAFFSGMSFWAHYHASTDD